MVGLIPLTKTSGPLHNRIENGTYFTTQVVYIDGLQCFDFAGRTFALANQIIRKNVVSQSDLVIFLPAKM